ncbi:putative endonuclease [Pillotina sp. SPG140]|jgi:putative endonuclease
MQNTTVKRGKSGEEQAINFLKKAGMNIIAQNVRSQWGEIDIIAQEIDTIIFVEVKRYSTLSMESLQHSINQKKQQRIIATAEQFLSDHREYNAYTVRFDVIFVENETIHHIPSAFVQQ